MPKKKGLERTAPVPEPAPSPAAWSARSTASVIAALTAAAASLISSICFFFPSMQIVRQCEISLVAAPVPEGKGQRGGRSEVGVRNVSERSSSFTMRVTAQHLSDILLSRVLSLTCVSL